MSSVARAGAARVFFDIVGTFQANRLISDTQSAATAQQAIMADAANSIAENFDDMASQILDSVGEITESFFEFESQMIRVRKFYGGMAGEAERFAQSSIALGEGFAFSGAEALKASAKTAQLKQVLESQEAIIEATRGGLLMAAVGEMETEMGMNRLIQLAQQTGFMMGNLTKAQYDALSAEQQANVVRGNTIRVLDQLNTVENSSVATMEDITFVLNQFSSQANIAGESIGEMAAMSALLLETGEEVSRAGTGLRMIYQRIGNANTDAVKVLQELMGGVEASVVTQMKLSDIIREIAPAYATMTAEQKRNLAVSIAGSRHYVKFLKIMENQERLVELQSAAHAGAYDAIGEYTKRAESNVFQMQQLQAITENVRVEIGENLAQAYIDANIHAYNFLNVIKSFTETDFGLNAMTNIINLAGLYQNFIAPFANVGFQVFNMIIGFKTLGAVQRAMSADAVNTRNRYIELTAQLKLQAAAAGELSVSNNYLVSNMKYQSFYANELKTSLSAYNMTTGAVKQLDQEMRIHSETIKIMTRQQEILSERGKFNARTHSITGEKIRYSTAALTDAVYAHAFANIELNKFQQLQNRASMAIDLYSNRIAKMPVLISNYNNLMAGGLPTLMKHVQAQREILTTRQQEHAILNSHIAILQPLTVAEEEELQKTVQLNNAEMHSLRIKQGLLRSDMLRAQIAGVNTLEMEEQIAVLDQEIQALQQKNNTLEQGLVASRQQRAANEASAVSAQKSSLSFRQQTVALMQTTGASLKAGLSMQRLQSSMMPLMMIVPFLVDSEKQMAVMMGGMLAMGVMRAVMAFQAKNIAMTKTVVLQAAVSGGMSLVAAGAAMLAATLLVDAFIGDKFLSSPLDNLNDFNDGLVTAESNLAGIMSDTDAILSGVVDKSFGEISNSVSEMDNGITAISQHIDELTAMRSGTTKDSALYNQLTSDIEAAEKAQHNLEGLRDARLNLSKIDEALAGKGFDAGVKMTSEEEYFFKKQKRGSLGYEIVGEGFNALKTGEKFFVEYTNLQGEFIEESYDTYNDAENRRAELIQRYNEQGLNAQQDYLSALLNNEKEAQEQSINLLTESNEQAMGEMFNFANAREELFFGQRQNFTGALYKQVSQGGIENLLHKTEIIQTNVFNGMTLPEMVSKVSDGVVSELKSRGVPIA